MSADISTTREGRFLADCDNIVSPNTQKSGISDWTKSNGFVKFFGQLFGLLVEVKVEGQTHVVNTKSLDKFLKRHISDESRNTIDTDTLLAAIVAKKTNKLQLSETFSSNCIVGTEAAIRGRFKDVHRAFTNIACPIQFKGNATEGAPVLYYIDASQLSQLTPKDETEIAPGSLTGRVRDFIASIFNPPESPRATTSEPAAPAPASSSSTSAAGAPAAPPRTPAAAHRPATNSSTSATAAPAAPPRAAPGPAVAPGPTSSSSRSAAPAPSQSAREDALIAAFRKMHNLNVTQEMLNDLFQGTTISMELSGRDVPGSTEFLAGIADRMRDQPIGPRLNEIVRVWQEEETQARAEDARAQAEATAWSQATHTLTEEDMLSLINSGRSLTLASGENFIGWENPRLFLVGRGIRNFVPQEFKTRVMDHIKAGEQSGSANAATFKMRIPVAEFTELLNQIRANRSGRAPSQEPATAPTVSAPTVSAPPAPPPPPAPSASAPAAAPLGLNPESDYDQDVVFETIKRIPVTDRRDLCTEIAKELKKSPVNVDRLKAISPQWEKLIVYSYAIPAESPVGEDNISREGLLNLDVGTLCRLFARSGIYQTVASHTEMFHVLDDKLRAEAEQGTLTAKKTEIRNYLETFAASYSDEDIRDHFTQLIDTHLR